MPDDWRFLDVDAARAAALADWLPQRLFDVHAHVYRKADLGAVGPLLEAGPDEVGVDQWRAHLGRLVGADRLQGALLIAMPSPGGDIAAANRFVSDQAGAWDAAFACLLASPAQDPDDTLRLLDRERVAGFKPYHLFSSEKPTFQSSLAGFAPEWMWEAADARGLLVVLHLVKDRALADPDTQRELLDLAQKFPRARILLAHAGRGFHAANTVEGVKALAGLDNVWLDTSAICEPHALMAILDAFGPRRLLWGSDFPIAMQRGRCVSIGDSFAWICPERIDSYASAPACRPALVGLESLAALRDAADWFGLNRGDLEDVFWGNAARLLGLAAEPGDRTQTLYREAKRRLPGGTQLLSKRPEMFAPDQWPPYFREARGCEVWDLDGRRYVDMSFNGIGACLLGFRDPDVTRAVVRRVRLGSMCTLNPPEEVELARRLCEIHPWAEQVRFARTGGEIAAIAVRLARAATGRDLVAISGYHGWHDWYLAANLGEDDSLAGHLLPGLEPAGVPSALRGTALTFAHGDADAFQQILDRHGERLAAVIMEPCRHHVPPPGFLERVREGTRRAGALLIFDEITIGWRWCFGGAHLRLGVQPDLAIFAKALGNGHPIAAVIGTRAAMEGAHRSFISSTYWTESVGPAAALAALEKFEREDAAAHVERIGRRVQELWRRHAQRAGLPVVVEDGFPCLARFRFDHPEAEALRTLFTQLMLGRGFLAGVAIYPTLAHTDEVVDAYGEAVAAVFDEIARVIDAGDVRSHLAGPVAHSGFRRLVT